MKQDNKVLDMIKNQDYTNALIYMENKIRDILVEKLNNLNIKIDKTNYENVLEVVLKNIDEYYDIIIYLKNLYFLDELTEIEKVYELVNIYESLIK